MPAGRPTKYQPIYAEQAYKLAMLGLTVEQMAVYFEVTTQTCFGWQKSQPEFFDAIKRGKTIADAEMTVSLYKRGMGYSHEAVKIFMPAGADAPVYAPYTERYPPDTNAASLWLRNRQPQLWRNQIEQAVTLRTVVNTPYSPSQLTDEQRQVMEDVLLLGSQTIDGEVVEDE